MFKKRIVFVWQSESKMVNTDIFAAIFLFSGLAAVIYGQPQQYLSCENIWQCAGDISQYLLTTWWIIHLLLLHHSNRSVCVC